MSGISTVLHFVSIQPSDKGPKHWPLFREHPTEWREPTMHRLQSAAFDIVNSSHPLRKHFLERMLERVFGVSHERKNTNWPTWLANKSETIRRTTMHYNHTPSWENTKITYVQGAKKNTSLSILTWYLLEHCPRSIGELLTQLPVMKSLPEIQGFQCPNQPPRRHW